MEIRIFPHTRVNLQTSLRKGKLARQKAALIATMLIAVGSITQPARAIVNVSDGTTYTINTHTNDRGPVHVNSGMLNIGSSGYFTSGYYAYLGTSSSGIGNAMVSGTWIVDGLMYAGWAGHGTLTIESGGYVRNGKGGIGNYQNVIGEAMVSGTWVNEGGLDIGYMGNGKLTIDNGGVVDAAVFVSLGVLESTASGTLIIKNGGTLATNVIGRGRGNGKILLDGGTLSVTGGDINNFFTGFTPGDITIEEGGVTINTNALQVGINAPLSGTGGLTKSGLGTLTLSGSTAYTGVTTVASGTLKVAGTHASSTASIASGATLEFLTTQSTFTHLTGNGTLLKNTSVDLLWAGSSVKFDFGSGSLIDLRTGTFEVDSSSNWTQNQSALNVATGATFKGGSASVKVGTLYGEGRIESGAQFTFGQDNGTGTFSGELADASGQMGNYIKAGTGRQLLSGNNSFTGQLTVAGGVLETANWESLGRGENGVSVEDGGTLQLNGLGLSKLLTLSLSGNGSEGQGALFTTGTSNFFVQSISLNNSAGIGVQTGGELTLREALTGGGSLTGGTLVKKGGGLLTIAMTGSQAETVVSEGTLNVSGTLSYSNLTVGDGSDTVNDASAEISGAVMGAFGYIGSGERGVGSASVSGTWSTIGVLFVGNSSTGRLTIEKNGLIQSFAGVAGFAEGSVGDATVRGFWNNSDALEVGYSGAGSLTIETGGSVSSSTVKLGSGATGSGTLALKGGTLSVGGISKGGGSAAIIFDGGKVIATGDDNSDFLSGFGSDDVAIAEGGFSIDTNGLQIGISAALSGTGGLTKFGSGTLTLSGLSSYSGGTILREGNLFVASNSSLGSGNVRVEGGVLTLANSVTLSQTVELDGGVLHQQISGNLAGAVQASHTQGSLTTSVTFLGGHLSGETTLTLSFSDSSGVGNDEMRLSSVLSLEGTGNSIFVLQLTMSQGTDQENNLGWLDTETNLWTDAVAGNTGNNASGAMMNYHGSFSSFQSEYGYDLALYLGAFGYDTETASVWAVLNHNSDFAVIPEPGTMVFLGLGIGIGYLFLRRRA